MALTDAKILPASGGTAAAFAYLSNFVPLLRWLPRYDGRGSLLGDVVAGLTVTAVAAPEAVSYAAIAGLPAAQGLYTGFLGPLAYAFAGSSPQLIVGPTAIMCILTNNAIPTQWAGAAVMAPGAKSASELRVELAALLALVVAGLQLLFALLRLGGLVALISTPVVAGFTSGSALLTASSQFSTLLGMAKCVGSSGGSCTFFEALEYIANSGGDAQGGVQGRVCLMSAVCLAILLLCKLGPVALRLPKPFLILSNLAPLVLVLIAVPVMASNAGAELEGWGLSAPVAIPAGLPTPFLPFGSGSLTRSGTRADVWALITAALPLAIIGYMGAVTISTTASRQNGPYPVDPMQELWAQVACNFACSIGRGLPVTGSFSRTAVNASSGATTAVASLLTALLMAASLEVLASTLSLVPSVARSAIVIVAIAKMVELHLFAQLWRSDKRDFLVFAATFAVVIFFDASTGLAAGVACQWLAALTRSAAAPSEARLFAWLPSAGPAAAAEWRQVRAGKGVVGREEAGAIAVMPRGGCVVLGFGPDLQFSNALRVRLHIEESVAVYAPAALVLDCARVGAVDTTGAAALVAVALDMVELHGCVVIACGLADHELDVVVEAARSGAKGAGTSAPNAAAPSAGVDVVAAGALLVVRSLADADILARVLCAAGLRNQAAMADPESLESPLLDVVVKAKSGSVIAGVPLSPHVEARRALRRGRLPLQPGADACLFELATAGLAEDIVENDDSAWRARLLAAEGGAAPARPLEERVAAAVRAIASDLGGLVDDTRPMLKVE